MMSIVKIGYTNFVVTPEQALELTKILLSAEVYESKYHTGGEHTYHIYEMDGEKVTLEMISEPKYQLYKLAGKPKKE